MPWYGYAAILAAIIAFGKFAANYATETIKKIELEDKIEQERKQK